MHTRRQFLASLASPSPRVTVFRTGEGGYHTARIPAIVLTKRKTLLAFAEARKDNARDSGNIDLVVKRSTDGGRTWSPMQVVADLGGDTIGNPAPVVERKTGRILLPLTRNPGQITEKQIRAREPGAARTVWLTASDDDGVTWKPASEITATTKDPDWNWYATGPGNGIQTRRGRLVIACDHDRGVKAVRYSHVIYSDDRGATWKLGGSAGPECNESTVVELHDGTLMLNMRSYAGKNRRAVSLSRDGGLTWTAPVLDESLIEPVCQASLIRHGRLLLFSNPRLHQARKDDRESQPRRRQILAHRPGHPRRPRGLLEPRRAPRPPSRPPVRMRREERLRAHRLRLFPGAPLADMMKTDGNCRSCSRSRRHRPDDALRLRYLNDGWAGPGAWQVTQKDSAC